MRSDTQPTKMQHDRAFPANHQSEPDSRAPNVFHFRRGCFSTTAGANTVGGAPSAILCAHLALSQSRLSKAPPIHQDDKKTTKTKAWSRTSQCCSKNKSLVKQMRQISAHSNDKLQRSAHKTINKTKLGQGPQNAAQKTRAWSSK